MIDDPNRWTRPPGLLAGLAVVLLPVPLFLTLALALGEDGLALLAVPTSALLAWGMLRLRGERWSDVGLRSARPRRLLVVVPVATLLLLVGSSVLAAAITAATGHGPDLSRFDALRGNPAMLVGGLLLVWTVAAFGEELVFRGFVMHSLHRLLAGRRAAWTLAVLVSSILFGAAHLYQGVVGAILAGAIGVGYAVAYFAARRSLWGSILTHGAYDTVGFVVVYLSLDLAAAA